MDKVKGKDRPGGNDTFPSYTEALQEITSQDNNKKKEIERQEKGPHKKVIL